MYLNTHTYYSLKYGTLSPRQLVLAAKDKGIDSLVLTDINNTSACFEFIQCCQAENIKPIVGIEFRNNNRLLYIGIARNQEGFYALNNLLSECSLNNRPLPDVAPAMPYTYIVYPRLTKPIHMFRENEFLGLRPRHINRLYTSPLKNRLDKFVVLHPVSFLDKEDYAVHRVLRAIDLNTLISMVKPSDGAARDEYLSEPLRLKQLYEPYPAIIENTQRIIADCSIELTPGLSNNRQSFSGNKSGDFELLSKLAINGCKRRYGTHNIPALKRVEKELKVIRQLDFCAYFLITWDIVRYAHSAGYHHVGRGSGANSIVAFCLYITDVDPLELDLYFERFINPHRSSPPDFDIDFSWDERDDVIDYIFKRYGKAHTALLATYNTFKGRSVIREVGKVFGLPKTEIDLIIRQPHDTARHHALATDIFRIGKKIEGFPNYLSIHAGGIIISEKPLNYFTALQMMPKGFPITHFDMYVAEDLGFHKFDVLSQRGLGHIKDAVALIRQNQEKAVNIHDIPGIKNNPEVREQLKSGHCIGCFYIESPAMRGLLHKLSCDNYIHLVAASSIIRPGVASSGMMREYIIRYHNPHAFEYLHPVFETHLKETFGVMVYQEDVMKICHHFAGLDLGESDVLRRVMTGKKRHSDTFRGLKEKFFRNCSRKGYSDGLTREVWRQIESFGGYAFCKAHSASFACESFQSLYLKTYFPLEFMVAVINNFGGFYPAEYYFHEARIQGGNIHPPCVNNSFHLTSISGKDIYIGFVHVQHLEKILASRIAYQRAKGGPFRSLEDFTLRVDISSEQLELLIRIGGFRFTGMHKCELMWEKNAVFNPKTKYTQTASLFEEAAERYELPRMEDNLHDQAFDEIELLGFPLCSPFDLLEAPLPDNTITASALKSMEGKNINILGYYVVRKQVITKQNKRMYFGTWLDISGHYFDTIHFPPSLGKFPFRGKGCYLIKGKVVLDFGFPSIEVREMEKLPFVKDQRY